MNHFQRWNRIISDSNNIVKIVFSTPNFHFVCFILFHLLNHPCLIVWPLVPQILPPFTFWPIRSCGIDVLRKNSEFEENLYLRLCLWNEASLPGGKVTETCFTFQSRTYPCLLLFHLRWMSSSFTAILEIKV